MADAVLGHHHTPVNRAPVAYSNALARGSETAGMLQPREDERHSMHGLDMAGCPTNAPNLCDVAAEDVISSYMVMQHAQDFKPTPLTLRPSSNSNHKNGPLVEPSLNNTHHDGPGLETHSGITT